MFTVTLTDAELELVTKTLGYRPPTRKVAERKPSSRPRTFGAPRLSESKQRRAVADWEQAVKRGGEWWRSTLALGPARDLGYHGDTDAVRA